MDALVTVPFENFIRLQFLIGDEISDVSDFCDAANVPYPDVERLLDIQQGMLESVPAPIRAKIPARSFPAEFVLENIEALMQADWEWSSMVLPYAKQAQDVQTALEHFLNPELRIRMDSLILSKRCSSGAIASAMSGWSKYNISQDAVELYSFYFCNLEVMGNFQAWKEYIGQIPDKQHRFFLGEAYDVQRDTDLLVLLNDLSIRDAVSVTGEIAVQELMLSSFVQIKKEERKVLSGIPAKNTAIFEWLEVYCKMFDRVRLALEEGNKVDALDRVRTNLKKIRTNVRNITDLRVSDGSPRQS